MMDTGFHTLNGFWMIMIFAWIAITILVAIDSTKFGENALIWSLVVLLMPMMGFVIYLVIRSTWTNKLNNVNYVNRNDSTMATPQFPQIVRQSSLEFNANIKSEKSLSDLNFCTNCGTSNEFDAIFCNKCGAQILKN